MEIDIKIPQSGTETEAVFLEWAVNVGDRISAGDVIASVETDKAVVEVEAEHDGVIISLTAEKDDEITLGQSLGKILCDSGAKAQAADLNDAVAKDAPQLGAMSVIRTPLDSVRKRAAQNLLSITQNAAVASTSVEVDFENVAGLRAKSANQFREREGFGLTFLPFVAFAASRSCEKFPQVSARIDLDTNEVVTPAEVNLGVAVACDAGLIVPVIRNAGPKSFVDLARAINQLSGLVRSSNFDPAITREGTISLTNPGSFGSFMSQPIMGPKQTSIICIDGVEKRAVVVDDKIVIRHRSILTLAFDHRVVDGQLALQFLNDMKDTLQSFDETFIEAGQ